MSAALTLLPAPSSDDLTDEQYLEEFAHDLGIYPVVIWNDTLYRRTPMGCQPVPMDELDEVLETLALLFERNPAQEFNSSALALLKEQGLVKTTTRINHVLQWLRNEGILTKQGRSYLLGCPRFLDTALEALETLPHNQEEPTHFAHEIVRIQRADPVLKLVDRGVV